MSTAEKITLGFDAAVTAGSGTVTLNGGTLYLGSGGIVRNGTGTFAANLNFSTGILGAKDNWSTSVPITLPAAGNVTIKAADASDLPHDIALTGVLSGAGGFTKAGVGALVARRGQHVRRAGRRQRRRPAGGREPRDRRSR